MKKIFSIVLISFLMLTGLINVKAETLSVEEDIVLDEEVQASDLDVGDPKLLPGHPFYFIKDWGRNIRSIMTFDPVKKAWLESKFANEKLIELKKMTELSMGEDSINKAINDYRERVQNTEELTAKIQEKAGEDEGVKAFSEKFTQHQILHDKILSKLAGQVPEGVFEKIKEARTEHIDKFTKTLSNIENTIDIPDRLVVALNKINGSDFKEIKDIEILDRLKEKLPEKLTEEMENKMNEKIDDIKERLESLPSEKQERFQEYIQKINGDNEVHLNIIDNIGGKVLSEKLEGIINTAREKSLEKIIQEGRENLNLDKLQKDFTSNESFLEKVKTLILENDLDKNAVPEIFRLVENAELNLDKAKELLNKGSYFEAFGEIKSSMSLSQNTENLIKRIAGFNLETGDATTIVCNDILIPVCGINGKTYRNICEAKKENIGIAYRGECEKQERVCAKINEQVNRNPLMGSTDQVCCSGLTEFRTSKSYSVCKNDDNEFECIIDKDCPLSRCAGETSSCVEGKCVIPLCSSSVSCIEVITPAKSPDGVCKEFSTPCDVPAGWVQVNSCEDKAIRLNDSDKQDQIKAKVQLREEALKAQEIKSNTGGNDQVN